MTNVLLVAARADLGLSQDEMAAALRNAGVPGCTKRQVARLEAGTVRWPQAHTRRALQEVTGKPLADLGFAEDGPSRTLLGSVPAGFPASALEGPWVTTYQFVHDGTPRHHADIAHVTAEPGGQIRATNHPPEPRTEGRARPFRNEIEAQLASRHLIGHWRNTSDTRYFGTVHLAVLPGEMVMEGHYTGYANDITVSAAYWKWVRLGTLAQDDLSGVVLREPAALYDLVMNHSQTDAPLALADVEETA